MCDGALYSGGVGGGSAGGGYVAHGMSVAAPPPDYIGCLSQMSNSFLPTDTDPAAGGGGGLAGGGVCRQNSAGSSNGGAAGAEHGGAAMSLPPTPVGSQLSGSQICTPLDGQVSISATSLSVCLSVCHATRRTGIYQCYESVCLSVCNAT